MRVPILVTLGVLCLARPALANQPPGPMVSLPEVLMLPLMMLLSLAGGAYAVRKRLGRKRVRFLWLGAVLLIFFSFTHEGLGWMTAMAFAGIAICRGLRMMLWGIRVDSYAHGVSAVRLTLGGGALILIASALAATATAFVGYWPMESITIRAVERFTAHQLSHKEESLVQGGSRFHEPDEYHSECASALSGLRGGRRGFELAEDGESFTLLVLPQEPFPFYPFNLLTSQPSLRVDETGAIRMIRVHDSETRCPPDAPVVLRVFAASPSRPGR